MPPNDSEAALVEIAISEARPEYERVLSQQAAKQTLGRWSQFGRNTHFERVRNYLTRHKGILSPIRHVPQEILQEIFLHFSETDAFYLKDDPRWQIAHVCQFWRASALSLSSLWSRLPAAYLTISDVLPKHQLPVLGEFIRRAGNAPLDISITDYRPHPSEPATHSTLILLIHHCERWRSLSMKGSISTLAALQPIEGRLHLLQVLSLHIMEYRPHRIIQHAHMFAVAPRLQIVSIKGRGCTRELELPFSQLIQYETSVPSNSINKAPLLHSLAITSCSTVTLLFRYSPLDRPYTVLQNLTKLIIRANLHGNSTRALLNLRLPSVTDICIESPTKTLCRDIYETIRRGPDPCLLTTLDLRIPHYTSERDLPLLLYVTPALTALRAGIFHPSNVRELAVVQGNKVLVPRLESCSFLVHSDSLSDLMRFAIRQFAIMRCETEDLRNDDVCRLKTFQVHDFRALALQTEEVDASDRKESCLQQADFENWRDDSTFNPAELHDLQAFESAVLKALPDGFYQVLRQKDGTWVDISTEQTPQIRKILEEIEKYWIQDFTTLIRSDLHACLQKTFHFSSTLEPLYPKSPISEHAQRIVRKWANAFKPILQSLHWSARDLGSGLEYLTYICNDHPIRSFPTDAINLIMYGDDSKGYLPEFTTVPSQNYLQKSCLPLD